MGETGIWPRDNRFASLPVMCLPPGQIRSLRHQKIRPDSSSHDFSDSGKLGSATVFYLHVRESPYVPSWYLTCSPNSGFETVAKLKSLTDDRPSGLSKNLFKYKIIIECNIFRAHQQALVLIHCAFYYVLLKKKKKKKKKGGGGGGGNWLINILKQILIIYLQKQQQQQQQQQQK